MDYARAYILNNYKTKDSALGITYDNLEVIRGLEGSVNEQGFMLTHTCVAGHSPSIVREINLVYLNCANDERNNLN